MDREKKKVGMVSLGCPKNRVDTERILGVLSGKGHIITPDEKEADVLIVNTCGFVESAKEESIDAILDLAQYKKRGKCQRLMSQAPEVDGIVYLDKSDVTIGEILPVKITKAMEYDLNREGRNC